MLTNVRPHQLSLLVPFLHAFRLHILNHIQSMPHNLLMLFHCLIYTDAFNRIQFILNFLDHFSLQIYRHRCDARGILQRIQLHFEVSLVPFFVLKIRKSVKFFEQPRRLGHLELFELALVAVSVLLEQS